MVKKRLSFHDHHSSAPLHTHQVYLIAPGNKTLLNIFWYLRCFFVLVSVVSSHVFVYHENRKKGRQERDPGYLRGQRKRTSAVRRSTLLVSRGIAFLINQNKLSAFTGRHLAPQTFEQNEQGELQRSQISTRWTNRGWESIGRMRSAGPSAVERSSRSIVARSRISRSASDMPIAVHMSKRKLIQRALGLVIEAKWPSVAAVDRLVFGEVHAAVIPGIAISAVPRFHGHERGAGGV